MEGLLVHTVPSAEGRLGAAGSQTGAAVLCRSAPAPAAAAAAAPAVVAAEDVQSGPAQPPVQDEEQGRVDERVHEGDMQGDLVRKTGAAS